MIPIKDIKQLFETYYNNIELFQIKLRNSILERTRFFGIRKGNFSVQLFGKTAFHEETYDIIPY